ncbi:MAG: Uma2 family endonuclease [Gammaproteobacteria bacterium]|nr:Uma2 family endonuclease [Gammaproteobacteria bacterium]
MSVPLPFLRLKRSAPDYLTTIEGPPDRVVKILSPGTEERDRGYKLKMYARYRVPEYWIVDAERRMIEIYPLGQMEYLTPTRYAETAVITCAQLQNLDIALSDVLPISSKGLFS